MTKKEQYDKLKQLENELSYFNSYGEVTLEHHHLETLKDLYKVYFPEFKRLNTTCSNCVKEILNVCISRFKGLKEEFETVAVTEPVAEEATTVNEVPEKDEATKPIKNKKAVKMSDKTIK